MAGRPRAGDWVCRNHGIIRPVTGGVVPACPACGSMALQVRIHPRGYPEYVEPAPSHCAGPDRHPLGPNRTLVGSHACRCPPVKAAGGRGHRSWRCRACGNEQVWPPHEDERRGSPGSE